MDDIKVSVITYVKNDVFHIEKCLRSVLDQTLKEIEVIIVDGGSTDGTLDVINGFAKTDLRVRVLSSDIGVGKQFNTGLKAAKGKYIGICESDDFLLPEMYEIEYEIAEKNDLDFLQTNVDSIYEVNGVSHKVLNYVYSDSSLYDTLICPCENDSMLASATWGFWTGIFNREFLIKNKIFMNETPGASYQDSVFFFLCKAYAKRAFVMKEAFYQYRMDNVHSSTNDPRRLKAMITEYDLLEERLKRSGMWDKYKNYCIRLRILAESWLFRILPKEGKKDYLPIIWEDILSKIDKEHYTGGREADNELRIIDAAKESPEKLQQVLSPEVSGNAVLDQFEKDVSEIYEKDNVVIFGAGKLGEKLWLFLAERGIFAKAFADNSSEKQGTEFCNTEVMLPVKAKESFGVCHWIIANLRHSDEIRSQLFEMGIDKNRILVCPGYDILQRMVPLKG